jgi:hypothetical protein
MRIYKVVVESDEYGLNYDSFNVSAKTLEQVIEKVRKSKRLEQGEWIQSITLEAKADL